VHLDQSMLCIPTAYQMSTVSRSSSVSHFVVFPYTQHPHNNISHFNTFNAKIDHSWFNNSCLRLPVSTLVDLIFQSRSFSLGGKLVQQLQYI
jgi:hypothetical protein